MSIISIHEINGKELVLEIRRNGAKAFFDETVDQMIAVIRKAQRFGRQSIRGLPNCEDFEEEGENDALNKIYEELRAIEEGLDKEINNFPAYLKTIYVHCVLDHVRAYLRRNKRIVLSIDDTVSEEDDERFENLLFSLGATLYTDATTEQQAIELLSFIAKLPWKQALVLTLFGLEYSHKEIAATLSISVVDSRTTLRRARQHLRSIGIIP